MTDAKTYPYPQNAADEVDRARRALGRTVAASAATTALAGASVPDSERGDMVAAVARGRWGECILDAAAAVRVARCAASDAVGCLVEARDTLLAGNARRAWERARELAVVAESAADLAESAARDVRTGEG